MSLVLSDRTAPRGAFVLAGSLTPGILAAFPLVASPVAGLATGQTVLSSTGLGALLMLLPFAVALTPFAAVVISLVSVRVAGGSWDSAYRVASRWAFITGAIALIGAYASGAL